VVECLPSKHTVLSTTPNMAKQTNKNLPPKTISILDAFQELKEWSEPSLGLTVKTCLHCFRKLALTRALSHKTFLDPVPDIDKHN
jgi:hypothetical protein